MKFVRVRQKLVSAAIADIEAAVWAELDKLGKPPAGEIAVTVGSRGIDHLVEITKACGDWLRKQGATPFVVPCMGSHGGATAEGQRQMIEALGCTEAAIGMPIRSSMECVPIGQVSSGTVWMDRLCHEAAGVLVVNRVKLHTSFTGPLQSGLTKMMVVGMGKIRSAQTFHVAPTTEMSSMLAEMGTLIVASGKIWAGLAILEDGYDRTAELHALSGPEILTREPSLLDKHRKYFPRLPLDEINVLVVNEIGKNYSGTGMDPNVIGRRGTRFEDLDKPDIQVIAALGLSATSHGNATGVGLADVITQRLRQAIDEPVTLTNVLTTGEMQRAKIPATLPNDQAVFEELAARFGQQRWVVIPNTLHLDEIWVSEDLAKELESRDTCTVVGKPREVTFRDGCHDLTFGWSDR